LIFWYCDKEQQFCSRRFAQIFTQIYANEVFAMLLSSDLANSLSVAKSVEKESLLIFWYCDQEQQFCSRRFSQIFTQIYADDSSAPADLPA
jgi:hypothetical protein